MPEVDSATSSGHRHDIDKLCPRSRRPLGGRIQATYAATCTSQRYTTALRSASGIRLLLEQPVRAPRAVRRTATATTQTAPRLSCPAARRYSPSLRTTHQPGSSKLGPIRPSLSIAIGTYPSLPFDESRDAVAVVHVKVQHRHAPALKGLEGVEGRHRREANEAKSCNRRTERRGRKGPRASTINV